MRIITKQSDFYDSVLGYGIDNTVIYKRKEAEFQVVKYRWANDSILSKTISGREPDYFRTMPKQLQSILIKLHETSLKRAFELEFKNSKLTIIGRYMIFCGEVIPFVRVFGKQGYYPDEKEINEFFYSKDKLIDFLSDLFTEKNVAKYLKKTSMFSDKTREQSLSEFFSGANAIEAEDLHHALDCPVLEINKNGYVTNPVLKERGFARKYDPFTTYQKLEHFISGVLGGQSPKMVEIADIDRLVGHGFDKKMSFRKENKIKNQELKMNELKLLIKVMNFAAEKHRNQRRYDEEKTPYINHPIKVAFLLVEYADVDAETLYAALLHDVIEDQDVTKKELSVLFGEKVASMVDEVSDDMTLSKNEIKKLQVINAPNKTIGAATLKIADKTTNLQDIIDNPPDWPRSTKLKAFKHAKQVVDNMPELPNSAKPLLDLFYETYEKGIMAFAKKKKVENENSMGM